MSQPREISQVLSISAEHSFETALVMAYRTGKEWRKGLPPGSGVHLKFDGFQGMIGQNDGFVGTYTFILTAVMPS